MKPIAMGYVNKGFHEVGTQVFVEIRKKMLPAVVEKMPFVPTRYYHPK
jgi:aminomethyltransferase